MLYIPAQSTPRRADTFRQLLLCDLYFQPGMEVSRLDLDHSFCQQGARTVAVAIIFSNRCSNCEILALMRSACDVVSLVLRSQMPRDRPNCAETHYVVLWTKVESPLLSFNWDLMALMSDVHLKRVWDIVPRADVEGGDYGGTLFCHSLVCLLSLVRC